MLLFDYSNMEHPLLGEVSLRPRKASAIVGPARDIYTSKHVNLSGIGTTFAANATMTETLDPRVTPLS